MANLSTSYMGLSLKSPFVIGASNLSDNEDRLKKREKRDTEIVQKLKKGLSIAKVAKEYNLAEITVFMIAKKGAIGRC